MTTNRAVRRCASMNFVGIWEEPAILRRIYSCYKKNKWINQRIDSVSPPRCALAVLQSLRVHRASPTRDTNLARHIYVIMLTGHVGYGRYMRAECRHFRVFFQVYGSVTHSRRTTHALKIDYFLPERRPCVGCASALVTGSWSALH